MNKRTSNPHNSGKFKKRINKPKISESTKHTPDT